MNGVAVALEYAGGFEAGDVEAGTLSVGCRVVERGWEGMRMMLVNYCELYIQRRSNGFQATLKVLQAGDIA